MMITMTIAATIVRLLMRVEPHWEPERRVTHGAATAGHVPAAR